jgi:adenylate cyclase
MASLPLMMVAHDFEAASSAVKRALEINPSCAFALFFGGQAQAYGGDHALAEDYATRALRLSPHDPQSFMALNALGFVRGLAGRLDEAASFFTQAVQANPRFSTLYIFQAAALAHAGRAHEAATAASRLLAMQPDFHLSSFRQFASGFCRKDMIDWLSAGIRQAGLPE